MRFFAIFAFIFHFVHDCARIVFSFFNMHNLATENPFVKWRFFASTFFYRAYTRSE